ncbi:MAG: hypothetical protein ABJC10_01370 [Acidobacteriota bacterium]
MLASLLLSFVPVVGQSLPTDPAAKLLPDKLGDFRGINPTELQNKSLESSYQRSSVTSGAGRTYVSKDGHRFSIVLITLPSDSAAYAELTQSRELAEKAVSGDKPDSADVGTSGFYHSGPAPDTFLIFFKGRAVVAVKDENKLPDPQRLTSFAKSLADTLDKGAGEIPVLVKHLPDWENKQAQVLYAANKEALINAYSNQQVLDVVSFEGGAEAAVADYGAQKLIIVEFNTASLATENDQRIKAKLQELGAQGQPAPTAYRRVGNYSVFVFDAPSAEAANQLIDQVKYQQVVQWLGRNPFSYEQATREFTETTLGVFVSVVKTSGLALVTCLAVGGFFGALLFRSRRAQQRAREAYADSDAMLRLNLDELTPETDPARLLERRN